MSTNYLTFFKLTDDPFRLTPDIAYFYNSPEHTTALLSLEYCVKEKAGFCILTGEPGTGKTTILRLFVEKWKDNAEIALTMTPRLSPEEFFMAILEDFKIPLKSTSKNDMLKAFRDFLLTSADNGRRVAIIVDEAQELPDTTLEELRLLSNMETEKEKLLQIILIGQPELRSKLLSQQLRQLNSRITVRIELKPLTADETSDYINNRLFRGGSSSQLFHEKARALIYELSGGIPRTINLLASRGLMSAFMEGSPEVFEKHVRRGAADVMEVSATLPASAAAASYRTRILAAILLLVAVTAALYFLRYASPPSDTEPSPPRTAPASPPQPVAGQLSSARQNVFATEVAHELSRADANQSAFNAFNTLAVLWDSPPAPAYSPSASDPWSYLSSLAAQSGLDLIQFKGTLDKLREIDYPVILHITQTSDAKELFTALTAIENDGFVLPASLGGKNRLTKAELESVWHGKAFIIWKNHHRIPLQIAAGSKAREVGSLQKLLRQAGLDAGNSGVFDQKTVATIKAFQASKGLRSSGQPEAETLLHLYKASGPAFHHPALK